MGIFNNLFGSKEAADNLLDKEKGLLVRAGGWINNFNYTDAEKAQNSLLVKEWGIEQLKALAPFKVVQRIIAFSVLGLWVFCGINTVVAIWVEAVWPDINIVEPMIEFILSDYVFWPALAVLSLYCTGGVMPYKGK